MQFKVGDNVETQHGYGEIVNIDLPNSRAYRYCVLMKRWKKNINKALKNLNDEAGFLVYFEKEIINNPAG